jgi:hypothetical protein
MRRAQVGLGRRSGLHSLRLARTPASCAVCQRPWPLLLEEGSGSVPRPCDAGHGRVTRTRAAGVSGRGASSGGHRSAGGPKHVERLRRTVDFWRLAATSTAGTGRLGRFGPARMLGAGCPAFECLGQVQKHQLAVSSGRYPGRPGQATDHDRHGKRQGDRPSSWLGQQDTPEPLPGTKKQGH